MLVGEFYDAQGWNEQRLRRWLSPFLIAYVFQIPFSRHQEDCIVWALAPSGEFSVSSTWEEVRQRRSLSLVDSFLWNSVTPLKISFFAWRLVRR